MTTSRAAAFEAWKRKASDADILDVAIGNSVNAHLRKAGMREWIGACPACGGDDRFSVNVVKGVFNCRGSGGGDVVAMVMHVCGTDFLGACEIITGEPPPAADPSERPPPPSPEETARRKAEREARETLRAGDDNAFRESEREKVYEMWRRGVPIAGTAAEAYLHLRGIAELPPELRLRCIPDMPYYDSGKCNADVIHRGPAVLAPIVGAASLEGEARFSGLHITYVDLNQPKGKASICSTNPAGETIDMPAKKVRGSKAGGHIELLSPANPLRLIIGEGIEKTLAVWFALMRVGRDLSTTAFWTSVDLGNLGGKAKGNLTHPTLRNEKTGRRLTIQGPWADLDTPGIAIPHCVEEVIILGDGSSDRFTTQCAVARGAQRFATRGRDVRVAWSLDNADFDDLLRMNA